jgi:citrate synthase
MSAPLQRAPKGLEGIVVTSTKISKIDGQAGKLIYRGYDIADLAGKVPFEAVAHLMLVGHIPDAKELDSFTKKLAENRYVSNKVMAFLSSAPKEANPLAVLRTAVSLIGMQTSENTSTLDSAISLTAQFPTVVAMFQNSRRGRSAVLPRGDLGHVANYLYMLSGIPPKEKHARALDAYFTLLADHGLNASTFASIVAISTLTDIYSAIVASIGTLKGPLHGGAPSQVWEMLQSIGDPARATSWLTERLKNHERIMGFGHRVYRMEDPRSKILKTLAKENADPKTFALASTVESEAIRLLHEEHPERPLDTNVEFYSSLVLNAVGIPADMFTSTFASSRVTGWCAHIMEQLSDNKLIRPSAEYTGPEGLKIQS